MTVKWVFTGSAVPPEKVKEIASIVKGLTSKKVVSLPEIRDQVFPDPELANEGWKKEHPRHLDWQKYDKLTRDKLTEALRQDQIVVSTHPSTKDGLQGSEQIFYAGANGRAPSTIPEGTVRVDSEPAMADVFKNEKTGDTKHELIENASIKKEGQSAPILPSKEFTQHDDDKQVNKSVVDGLDKVFRRSNRGISN